jgi:cation diffusion facilitator CzcD-associated flavoprotein CzcO
VRTDTGERLRFTANFLWMCQGYYRHEKGYTPEWPGMDDFRARSSIRRPGPRTSTTGQARARDRLGGDRRDGGAGDRRGVRAHVTMLQRSPTYFIPGRNANELADTLRELEIDETWIHEIVRRKILFDQERVHPRAVEDPRRSRQELLGAVRAYLGRTTTSTPTSRRATAPGAAHRVRARRRPVQGHQARARPRSSPTRSSASPRRASC